jgi:hypothetical protein
MRDHPIFSHPIPRSSAASSGVPHTRQITAEQSPQISGSLISRAQLGQYRASGENDAGWSVSGIPLSITEKTLQSATP